MRIVLLILLVLVVFELKRQGSPATVRLRQTIEFETPGGPVTGSSVVELRSIPAVPYLPGGEFGHHKTEGDVSLRADRRQAGFPAHPIPEALWTKA